jgi:hypothetical protein
MWTWVEVSVDSYSVLRLVAAQLTNLLGEHPPVNRQEVDGNLADILSRARASGHAEAKAQCVRIETELKGGSPNHSRIGADLLHLARVMREVKDTAVASRDVADDVNGIADDAEAAAKIIAPIVTMLLL